MTVPALQINLVEFAPKGPSRLIVHIHGVWQQRTPPRRRPVLVVDLGEVSRRFSPLQVPRRRSFERFADWSVSFVVPASLGPSLDGHMSLAFGDDLVVPLPALFESSGAGAQQPETPGGGERAALAQRRSRLERRPVSETGRARRAARMRDESRLSSASARLRRELDRLQRELRAAKAARDEALAARDEALTARDEALTARDEALAAHDRAAAERDTYYRTANAMAKRVADMHSQMTAAVRAMEEMRRERERLERDLASLRGELHAAGEPPSRRAAAARRA